MYVFKNKRMDLKTRSVIYLTFMTNQNPVAVFFQGRDWSQDALVHYEECSTFLRQTFGAQERQFTPEESTKLHILLKFFVMRWAPTAPLSHVRNYCNLLFQLKDAGFLTIPLCIEQMQV